MKTKIFAIAMLMAGMMLINVCSAQNEPDRMLASQAFHSLKKANKANILSIVCASASNIEMAAIGGFPLEPNVELSGGIIFTHMTFSITRVVTSFIPPSPVAKARKILEPWHESPEMHFVSNKFFKKLDAAKVLTAVAPVLTVTGGAMMFAASSSTKYDYSYGHDAGPVLKRPGLKTTGWILVGTGLAASISSAVLIGQCKRELTEKYGTVKLTASASSIGMQYNFPSKN